MYPFTELNHFVDQLAYDVGRIVIVILLGYACYFCAKKTGIIRRKPTGS